MNIKRTLQHLVIVVYIAATASAFSYTLFRYKMPGVPDKLRRWSYGMMAPYQTYRTSNEMLTAEGLRSDGTWEDISLDEYLPFLRGERGMRSYLLTFWAQGEEVLAQKYKELADVTKRLESDRGRQWEDVRLTLEKWPMSPAGYEYLRHEPFVLVKKLHD